MSLEDFYLLSQILASVAVVVSLLFVGFQLRESNRQSRLSAIQSSIEFEIELSRAYADHAGTWDKVITGKPLENEAERREGIVLFNILMSESENRYYHYHHGHLDRQSWEGRLNSLKKLVQLPIYDHWQNSIGGQNHTRDFLDLLKSLRSPSGPTSS